MNEMRVSAAMLQADGASGHGWQQPRQDLAGSARRLGLTAAAVPAVLVVTDGETEERYRMARAVGLPRGLGVAAWHYVGAGRVMRVFND